MATASAPAASTAPIGLHLDDATIAAAHLRLVLVMADLGGEAYPSSLSLNATISHRFLNLALIAAPLSPDVVVLMYGNSNFAGVL